MHVQHRSQSVTGPYRPVKQTGPLTTIQYPTLYPALAHCVYKRISTTYIRHLLHLQHFWYIRQLLHLQYFWYIQQLLHLQYFWYIRQLLHLQYFWYIRQLLHLQYFWYIRQLLHLQHLNPSIHQRPDAGPVCEASEMDTQTERTDRLTHHHPPHSQPSPSPPRFSTQPGSSGFRCPRPAS